MKCQVIITLRIFLLIFLCHFTTVSGQIDSCMQAVCFCSDSLYNIPAPTSNINAQVGPDYGCLGAQPNPAWYYLKVDTGGPIIIDLGSSDPINDDIDFVCWGPFDSLAGVCDSGLTSNCSATFSCYDNTVPFAAYPSGNLVDCSYDPQSAETCTIPAAVAGKHYILLITNYGGNMCNLVFNQINNGIPGAGHTGCSRDVVGLDKKNRSSFNAYPTLLSEKSKEIVIESPVSGPSLIQLLDYSCNVNWSSQVLLKEGKNLIQPEVLLSGGIYLLRIQTNDISLVFRFLYSD